eukprot:scaffold24259_cov56-Isochrysis_galbana.AAC.1
MVQQIVPIPLHQRHHPIQPRAVRAGRAYIGTGGGGGYFGRGRPILGRGSAIEDAAVEGDGDEADEAR